MKKQQLILYIYLVLLCSCNNTSLTNTLLKSANDYMSERPDSALMVLERLNYSDIKVDTIKPNMRYCTLKL